jgi:uncharacterized membrane protein YfcA
MAIIITESIVMHISGFILIFISAVLAGMLNSVAGGGSLISFPTLVAVGHPAIIANATNTAGIWPGTLSSAIAYRKDTAMYRGLLVTLIIPSMAGGLLGAFALVVTPPDIFDRIVPFLVLFATVLFMFKDHINKIFRTGETDGEVIRAPHKIFGFLFQLFIATYGGYFGAGIGILMLGALSVMGLSNIHTMNGLKVVLGTMINIIAFIFFAIKGLVVWPAAFVLASGAIIGGYAGARTAKKIPQKYIRGFVILVGIFVSVWLFIK